ncbi:MAG: TerB family tellurite resistance protein [Chitinophagales bacterium]
MGYEKWLGAGVGFLVGGPVGGIMGYLSTPASRKEEANYRYTSHTSAFETDILLLAAEVIKVDGKPNTAEKNFVRQFFSTYFDVAHIEQKMNILEHCFNHQYDVRKACQDLRAAASMATRTQLIQFLMDTASADKAITKEEEALLFKLAGWLNINDVTYRKLRHAPDATESFYYPLLKLPKEATNAQLKAAYRKAILACHPDRQVKATEVERKKMETQFRNIQKEWERIKAERQI